MGDLPTIKVKSGDSHAIINQSDYNPDVHEPFDEESANAVGQMDRKTDAQRAAEFEDERRRIEANRGVGGGRQATDATRNPSGTFSEPTPTDVRYPNKDATEFENNHGAFMRKSAAQIREDRGMEQKPGGTRPDVHEKVQAAQAAAVAATEAASAASDAPMEGLRTGKGPGGKFFVYDGKDRVSGAMDSEEDAGKALDAEKARRAEQSAQAEQANASTASGAA